MTIKTVSQYFSTILVGAALAICAGCGNGKSGGAAINQAEVSQLEAKVATGDADAAMKLAEMYANKVNDKESQIEAAKWFQIAGRLGSPNAQLGLDAITKTMSVEDQTDAQLRATNYKLPQK